MATIFAPVLEEKFWRKTQLTPDIKLAAPLFSSKLLTKYNNVFKHYRYDLYPSQLLCKNYKMNKSKFADITFSTLSPFTQMNKSIQEFGFCLDNKEFFVSTEAELKVWLGFLKPMCVLNNLEEDFVVLKEIGNGGTSTVHLARSLENGQNYAIKTIQKERIFNHNSGLDNLLVEISIMRDLDHSHIAKLHYVYESSDTVDLVIEYLPGGSLNDMINKQKRLSEDKCKKIARELLETLEYLHNRSIVHRDLKLENIILTGNSDLEFKIIDFGLAFEGAKEGGKCGSAGYVAPEIMLKDDYDSKIDVYSTGVIIYVLLCGKHPFTGRNEEKLLKNNIKGKFSLRKDLSQEAKSLIKKMMETDPEKRPDVKQILDMPWFADEKECESAFITS